MTPADIQKEAGKGKYKGTPRAKIFLLKIGDKSPFTLNSGQKVIGTKWDAEKRILYAGTKQISLKDIKKDEDFGGGGGSGAGADVTAAVESGQCFVSSIAYNILKREIKWEDLTLENLNAAAKYCDTDIPLDVVIEKSPAEWIQSYVKTANITFKNYKMAGAPVYFHRGSKFMAGIYAAKKIVFDADKKSNDPQAPGSFSDDKWNPGDIWQTTLKEVPKLSTDSWGALNADIYKFAQEKKMLAVSLKKIGATAHVEEYNKPKTGKSTYHYEGFRITSGTERGEYPPFFNSIDLYMKVSGKEIQFRATSGEASWQGEIKGATAAGGKIGGGNVNFYLKKYTGKGVFRESESEILRYLNTPEYWKEFYDLYKKHFNEAKISGKPVSFDEFKAYASAKQKDSKGYLFSKFINMKFIDIFLSVPPNKRDEIAESFFKYAASNTDQSSYFIKVS